MLASQEGLIRKHDDDDYYEMCHEIEVPERPAQFDTIREAVQSAFGDHIRVAQHFNSKAEWTTSIMFTTEILCHTYDNMLKEAENMKARNKHDNACDEQQSLTTCVQVNPMQLQEVAPGIQEMSLREYLQEMGKSIGGRSTLTLEKRIDAVVLPVMGDNIPPGGIKELVAMNEYRMVQMRTKIAELERVNESGERVKGLRPIAVGVLGWPTSSGRKRIEEKVDELIQPNAKKGDHAKESIGPKINNMPGFEDVAGFDDNMMLTKDPQQVQVRKNYNDACDTHTKLTTCVQVSLVEFILGKGVLKDGISIKRKPLNCLGEDLTLGGASNRYPCSHILTWANIPCKEAGAGVQKFVKSAMEIVAEEINKENEAMANGAPTVMVDFVQESNNSGYAADHVKRGYTEVYIVAASKERFANWGDFYSAFARVEIPPFVKCDIDTYWCPKVNAVMVTTARIALNSQKDLNTLFTKPITILETEIGGPKKQFVFMDKPVDPSGYKTFAYTHVDRLGINKDGMIELIEVQGETREERQAVDKRNADEIEKSMDAAEEEAHLRSVESAARAMSMATAKKADRLLQARMSTLKEEDKKDLEEAQEEAGDTVALITITDTRPGQEHTPPYRYEVKKPASGYLNIESHYVRITDMIDRVVRENEIELGGRIPAMKFDMYYGKAEWIPGGGKAKGGQKTLTVAKIRSPTGPGKAVKEFKEEPPWIEIEAEFGTMQLKEKQQDKVLGTSKPKPTPKRTAAEMLNEAEADAPADQQNAAKPTQGDRVTEDQDETLEGIGLLGIDQYGTQTTPTARAEGSPQQDDTNTPMDTEGEPNASQMQVPQTAAPAPQVQKKQRSDEEALQEEMNKLKQKMQRIGKKKVQKRTEEDAATLEQGKERIKEITAMLATTNTT